MGEITRAGSDMDEAAALLLAELGSHSENPSPFGKDLLTTSIMRYIHEHPKAAESLVAIAPATTTERELFTAGVGSVLALLYLAEGMQQLREDLALPNTGTDTTPTS